jgi:hypothetical protein
MNTSLTFHLVTEVRGLHEYKLKLGINAQITDTNLKGIKFLTKPNGNQSIMTSNKSKTIAWP